MSPDDKIMQIRVIYLVLSAYYAFLSLIFTKAFTGARYLVPFYHELRGLRSRETEEPVSQLSAGLHCDANLIPRSALLISNAMLLAPWTADSDLLSDCGKWRAFKQEDSLSNFSILRPFKTQTHGCRCQAWSQPPTHPGSPMSLCIHRDPGEAGDGGPGMVAPGGGKLQCAPLGPQATSLLAIYLLVLSKTH